MGKGIQYLLDLLNEFEGLTDAEECDKWYIDEINGTIEEGGWYSYLGTEQKIVSKRFGFIKWLVKQDKIDFVGMSGQANIIKYLRDVKKYDWDEIKEGVVLIQLSISNDPISYLLSILQ